MNDFNGLLGTDFKLKQQSAAMSSKGSLHFTKTSSLNFDSTSRSSRSHNQDSALFSDLFNVDSISRSSSSGFASHSINSPVYDKPVYDDDSVSRHDGRTTAFDDLLGGFGHSKKAVDDFDDLISGFGNSKPSSRQRCGDCAYLLIIPCFLFNSTHDEVHCCFEDSLFVFIVLLAIEVTVANGLVNVV